MLRISSVNLWVHDQDVALDFWTAKVGFELRSDASFAELRSFRWLTVGPPGQPDVELVLMAVPEPPVLTDAQIGVVSAAMSQGLAGPVFLVTDDVERDFRGSRSAESSSPSHRSGDRSASTPASATRPATRSGSPRCCHDRAPAAGGRRAGSPRGRARSPDEEGWSHPSLCEGWDVRNVIAHVTMAARYDEQRFAAELAADGFDFQTTSDRIALRDGDLSPEALIADLRSERWRRSSSQAAGGPVRSATSSSTASTSPSRSGSAGSAGDEATRSCSTPSWHLVTGASSVSTSTAGCARPISTGGTVPRLTAKARRAS